MFLSSSTQMVLPKKIGSEADRGRLAKLSSSAVQKCQGDLLECDAVSTLLGIHACLVPTMPPYSWPRWGCGTTLRGLGFFLRTKSLVITNLVVTVMLYIFLAAKCFLCCLVNMMDASLPAFLVFKPRCRNVS